MKYQKSDIRYWRARVTQRTEGSNYGVQMTYKGKRARFSLGSLNKEAAAAKAREIRMHLEANGWQDTLERYKPSMSSKKGSATLGDYLKAVDDLSTHNSKTLAVYITKVRTIIGEMKGLKKGKEVANPQGEAFKDWRRKVDSMRLSDVTAAKIQKWKKARIEKAEDPVSKARAIRTVNSMIRNAKSLFSAKIVSEVAGQVALEAPLPFADVSLEKTPKKQFKSILKELGGLPWLIAAAKTDLTPELPSVDHDNLRKSKEALDEAISRHQQFKILLLSLACGMRRGEIDTLRWRALDFQDNSISIATTEHGSLKTDSSEAEIGAPPQVMEALKAYMPHARGEFVIESNRKPNPNAKHPAYRCQLHFRRLSDWLRSKGIDAAKPLHQLRGECATAIAAENGILAAAQQLRHASLQTTKTYYSDRLRFSYPEVGEALESVELKSINQ